jgi:hypothetical protein
MAHDAGGQGAPPKRSPAVAVVVNAGAGCPPRRVRCRGRARGRRRGSRGPRGHRRVRSSSVARRSTGPTLTLFPISSRRRSGWRRRRPRRPRGRQARAAARPARPSARRSRWRSSGCACARASATRCWSRWPRRPACARRTCRRRCCGRAPRLSRAPGAPCGSPRAGEAAQPCSGRARASMQQALALRLLRCARARQRCAALVAAGGPAHVGP